MTIRSLLTCLLVLGAILSRHAEARESHAETAGRIEQLPAAPGPHWLWVYDMVYEYMANGRAVLLDGDSGRFLGMLNGGYSFTQLTLPRRRQEIYSAETHYSRTTRGERTDIVAIYDPRTLAPVHEIVIPPKRGSTIPTVHNAVLTDDDRFMLVFNIAPATSVTVVDVERRRFAGEIETPGCGLIYPAGARRFFMLCADGTALVVRLDDAGGALDKQRTGRLFEPAADWLSEKGTRYGDTWIFVSFAGWIHTVDVRGQALEFGQPWSLLTPAERQSNWRAGGTQHLAVHASSGELYSIMHQSTAANSRKDPGRAVWIYDLKSRRKTRAIELQSPAGLIALTQDDHPLLFAADVPVNEINVYDAGNGKFQRKVAQIGYSPTGLQVPWQP
jgi:methylamine dehydrogenase heavy chain